VTDGFGNRKTAESLSDGNVDIPATLSIADLNDWSGSLFPDPDYYSASNRDSEDGSELGFVVISEADDLARIYS
jgi:hypothetical protein